MDRPLVYSVSDTGERMQGTTDNSSQVFDASKNPDSSLRGDLLHDTVKLVQGKTYANPTPMVR